MKKIEIDNITKTNIRPSLTIFTPTYNRAYCLPRLYESLLKQDSNDFEWLVIDDGSVDDTPSLLKKWLDERRIDIRYFRVANGGKQRAINMALEKAVGKFFFILDSDDYIEPYSVSWIKEAFSKVPSENRYIGISGVKIDVNGRRLSVLKFKDYVDASNLERVKWGLNVDMAEVFYTEKLKQYKFEVWDGEIFLPEAVVWNKIALDGYILRWYDKPFYICEYQPDGLSHGGWRLLRDNPMGYAKLFQLESKLCKDSKEKLKKFVYWGSCCMLGREIFYYLKYKPVKSIVFFPLVLFHYIHRKNQIRRYAKD